MAQVTANGSGGIVIEITDADELVRVMGALKRTKSTRVAAIRRQVARVVAAVAAADNATAVVEGFENLLIDEAAKGGDA